VDDREWVDVTATVRAAKFRTSGKREGAAEGIDPGGKRNIREKGAEEVP
jgi:hypothetical protein